MASQDRDDLVRVAAGAQQPKSFVDRAQFRAAIEGAADDDLRDEKDRRKNRNENQQSDDQRPHAAAILVFGRNSSASRWMPCAASALANFGRMPVASKCPRTLRSSSRPLIWNR